MTLFEIFKNSLGIVLPEEREKGKHDDVYFSIKDIREKHGMLFKIHKNNEPIGKFFHETDALEGSRSIFVDLYKKMFKGSGPV